MNPATGVDEESDTHEITISELVGRLQENEIKFNIEGELCPVLSWADFEGQLYIVLQGKDKLHYVAPNSLDGPTAAAIIENIKPMEQPQPNVTEVPVKKPSPRKPATPPKSSTSTNNNNNVKQMYVRNPNICYITSDQIVNRNQAGSCPKNGLETVIECLPDSQDNDEIPDYALKYLQPKESARKNQNGVGNNQTIFGKPSPALKTYSRVNMKGSFILSRKRPITSDKVEQSWLFCPGCSFRCMDSDIFGIHQMVCTDRDFTPNKNHTEESFDLNPLNDSQDSAFLEDKNAELDEEGQLSDTNSADFDTDSDVDTQLDGLRENDLVWVKVRAGLWPAFIMKLWIDQRKAEVQLIHSNLKKSSMKLSVDKLLKYDDGAKNMKRKNLKDDRLFLALQSSEQYMKKKLFDENLNPYVFFSPNKIAAPPVKRPKFEIDSLKVANLIKNGLVETHLISIYKELSECERHQKWKNNQIDELHGGFGPIHDEEQQDELRTYCTNLFNKNFSKVHTEDTLLYIMNVWIPESIIKCLSKTYNIDPKEAESYFT